MKIQKIYLNEDYFNILSSETQKEINSHPELRDKIRNNEIDINILNSLQTNQDIENILTNSDLKVQGDIKFELLKR